MVRNISGSGDQNVGSKESKIVGQQRQSWAVLDGLGLGEVVRIGSTTPYDARLVLRDTACASQNDNCLVVVNSMGYVIKDERAN